MSDYRDMGTQSGQERIDELLNGYIDDELAARQHTEVERLLAHDPKIEQRLQQLRKCRTLLSSLPCAEAPPRILQAVETSLASTARLYEQSSSGRRAGRIHLLTRKILSAAAMLALVGLLVAVVYTIISPESPPGRLETPVSGPGTPRALAFSGRLELTTSMLEQVGTVVNAAIRENGLADSIGSVREPHQHIHYLRCSEEGLDSLLASLDGIWSRFDSAAMTLDTGVFTKPVTIDSVTADQINEIIAQDSDEKRLELAKSLDLLNTAVASMPGAEVLTAIEGTPPDMPNISKPFITGPEDGTGTPRVAEADKTIRLTIILSR